MGKSSWPNILSATRIALMPAVLTTAIAGWRGWFVALLVIALATDALDGFIARRLRAYSELGRKLDSVADYLTLFVGLAGLALLWPDVVRRELGWIAAALMAFFAAVIYGLLRLGRAPFYHTWGSKAAAVACALSLVPLLGGGSAAPFHVVVVFQVAVGLEEVAIEMLVPWHKGEMPTAWHAWRLRRESTALLRGRK
jgi:phosphatidylglycerophosphate synthase